MRAWHRAFLGVLLVGAVAAAGIALNFTLLRMTQDAHDPVGRLSPRAVFTAPQGTDTTPIQTTTVPAEEPGRGPGNDHDSDD
jgi:hypothetical protein